MNWQKMMIVLTSIQALGGCAFDPQPHQGEAPKPVDPASNVVSVARVQWGEKEGQRGIYESDVSRPVLKEGGPEDFRLGHPVTVPATVPSSIGVQVQLPIAEQPLSIAADAVLNAEEGALKALTVENPEVAKADIGTSIRLQLSGLKEILTADRESRAFVKLTISNAETHRLLATLRLIVMTPPSDIELTGMKVSELPDPSLSPLLKLETMRMRLDLVQVLKIKNTSPSPVEVALPLIPTGKVAAHFHRLDLSQRMCSYSVNRVDWDEVYTEQVYLLPLSPEIKEGFEPFINARMEEKLLRLSFLPGEVKLVGVYGLGAKVSDLMVQGPTHSAPSSVSVVTNCRSRCTVAVNQGPNFRDFWERLGFPGGSRACLVSICWVDHPQGNEAACNECMEWEVGRGVPFNDGNRRCMGYLPGNPFGGPTRDPWQVEKYTGSTEVGMQTYPVKLDLDATSATLRLRTAFVPATDDPESSSIQFPTPTFVVFE